jgi:putative ABC transport system permease protein
MFTTTIRGILAHKARLMTTALAVLLGVAFLTGTLVLTDTVGRTFDNLFSDVYRNVDAVVRGEAAFEGVNNTGAQRPRVDAALVQTVAAVDGVAQAEGTIFGYARLIGKDGEALGDPARGAPTLGANWSDSEELNPFRLSAGGAPQADDEVVIDRKSATDGQLNVGDVTTVLVQGGPQPVRIAGIARFGTADSPGGASFVMFRPDVAQRLIAEPGKYDSVSLVADQGVSQDDLVRRVSRALPSGIEVITGAAVTKEVQSDVRSAMSFFNTFMLVFAIVALLVGGFMIFNTFSITVAQRTRENAVLRALGASRRQILASVLFEATAIGLVASVIGLAVGALVGRGLQGLLNALGFDIPADGIVFAPRTVVLGLLVGIAVTVVAALSPARKAAKIPPVVAMHTAATGSTGYGSKQRVIVGLAVLALGVASLFYGLFAGPSSPVGFVGSGMVLVFFGVSILGRTVSLPLSRSIGSPLPRLRGTIGELARENAMRNPKRTAASASALMIGVGLVAFITILASSTNASLGAAIDRAFTGDFIIDSGGGQIGGVDPGLVGRVAALPEVESATAVRQGMASVDSKVELMSGLDPATGFDLIDVGPLEGSPKDLGPGTVAIYKDVASDKGLHIGDTVSMRFKDTGDQQLRVAMIYGEDQPVLVGQPEQHLGHYLLDMDTYEANFANRLDQVIFVKAADSVSAPSTRAAIEQVTEAYPGTKVLDQRDAKREQAKSVNQVLGLVYALLALAILIALLGIGNTLALSILERTRELGLLRALGMTRSQLRATVRWESVLIALQGTALGLLIGVFFGWALVAALADQGIDVFRVPYASLVVVVVLAALAGVLAAVLPARRAARLNVLDAISHE